LKLIQLYTDSSSVKWAEYSNCNCKSTSYRHKIYHAFSD